MNDTLRYIEARLAYDCGSPTAEWEVVEELFRQFPAERESVTRWLFEQHNGYIDTRTRSGLEFIERNPSEGWSILEQLVSSGDPDDRDTALAVLETLGNDDAARLALPLLGDEWTYIKLEAATFVRRFYLAEATKCLKDLLLNKSPSVREEARKLLAEMEKDR